MVMTEWTILEQQATAFNCDLIVKGTIDGAVHGMRYDPVGQLYVCDFATAPLTHAQLVAKIQAGDVLTVMGVPKGAGQRMGIDRDMDGTPDSLDTSAVRTLQRIDTFGPLPVDYRGSSLTVESQFRYTPNRR